MDSLELNITEYDEAEECSETKNEAEQAIGSETKNITFLVPSLFLSTVTLILIVKQFWKCWKKTSVKKTDTPCEKFKIPEGISFYIEEEDFNSTFPICVKNKSSTMKSNYVYIPI